MLAETETETAGLFALLGALAKVGATHERDYRGCQDRLKRLTGLSKIQLTKFEFDEHCCNKLESALKISALATQFRESSASQKSDESHPPLKRPRQSGLNGGFL